MKIVKNKDKQARRTRRHARIRTKISGTTARPRLSVFRSNKYFLAQVINDETGNTIASVSTQNAKKGTKPGEAIPLIAKELASMLKEKKSDTVVFDRGGFVYTGTIKAFADALRGEGIVF